MTRLRLLLTAAFVVSGIVAEAGDWTRFRGPNGTGVSQDTAAMPVAWSTEENLRWSVALPGPGVSSPIVVGDRVYVTCYSGYGVSRENPGELENLKRHLICVDAATGKILWDKSVTAAQPEDPYTGIGIPSHGYASHTPVSDGERVYVFFGKSGALAFDLDGNQLWQTPVGQESDPWNWGSASSPILYKKLLIVTASAESQALVALNTETGETVWRQEASGLDGVWGTPALIEPADGPAELVLGVPNEFWGFNPENGKLRWYAQALQGDQFQSSVTISDGVVYAIEGRSGGSIAVRAGGTGDVSDSHVVWTGRETGRFGTPVVHDGRMYHVANGIVTVLDASSGEKLTQTRLQGGQPGGSRGGGGRPGRGGGGFGGFGGGGMDYASPVIADGKLYYQKGNGDVFVIKIGDEVEQLAVNRVTDAEGETFGATPAVSNGRLLLRSNKALYCIAAE